MFLAPVAALGGGTKGTFPPEHKFLRAEKMRIDCIKKFQIFVKFFQIFIKIFLKSFTIFLKPLKIFN